jgi:hypothetical protein
MLCKLEIDSDQESPFTEKIRSNLCQLVAQSAVFTFKIKWNYPSIYTDNSINLLKANSLKP